MTDIVRRDNAPVQVAPGGLIRRLADSMREAVRYTGIDRLIGGIEVWEQGMSEIASGLGPLLGELVDVHHRDVSLAEAVFDTDRYMHLPRAHGWIRDIYEIRVPAALVPWIRRIYKATFDAGPPPGAEETARWLVTLAYIAVDPATKSLARFALFEFLCLNQRVALALGRIEPQELGGRADVVEQNAEREMLAVENRKDYKDALLKTDDPLRVLFAAAMANLEGHVEELREAVAWVNDQQAEGLARRARILEVMKQVDPADAVIIRNAVADEFEDQSLAVEQLKNLHPGHLGGMSEDAIYKRKERLPSKISSGKVVKKGQTLMEILVEVVREVAE